MNTATFKIYRSNNKFLICTIKKQMANQRLKKVVNSFSLFLSSHVAVLISDGATRPSLLGNK
jgi:hypothetical protein